MWRLTVLALLLAPVARADVAPANETCTLANEKGPEATCDACPASREAPDACAEKHATDGYRKRCSTQGATVWTEIWCNNDSKPSGCASAGAPALGLLAALGLRRRRS